MVDIKLKKQGVYLGRAGETGRKRVWLDITAWEEEYGPGEGLMLYRNPEGKIIPMETLREEGTDAYGQAWVRLYGTVGETETAVAGVGNIEARLLSAGVVVKSDSFSTLVALSMDTGRNADEKTPKWVRQLMADLKAARIYVDTVKEIEDVIDGYRDAAAEEMLASEAWAVGTRNGEPVGDSDPAYENNAKHWAKESEDHADDSADSAEDAEAFALGKRNGTNVSVGDETYNNNSRYYSQQAYQSAQNAMADTPEGYQNLVQSIAPLYSSDETYAIGDYSVHDGNVYRCVTPIQTPEAWTPSHWFQTTVYDEISAVKNAMDIIFTNEAKIALLQCFENLAWAVPNGGQYYDVLNSMLNPPANVTRITAVYTQTGTVYAGSDIRALRSDLVVTAHYGDNTTGRVYAYILSGELREGTSTITVSYVGKLATFDVTVTDNTLLYALPEEAVFDGTAGKVINTGITPLPTDREITIVLELTTSQHNYDYVFGMYSGYSGLGLQYFNNLDGTGYRLCAPSNDSPYYAPCTAYTPGETCRYVVRKQPGQYAKIDGYNATAGYSTAVTSRSTTGGVSDGVLFIGAQNGSSTYRFVGTVSDFKVYKRYFSDSETLAYLYGEAE